MTTLEDATGTTTSTTTTTTQRQLGPQNETEEAILDIFFTLLDVSTEELSALDSFLKQQSTATNQQPTASNNNNNNNNKSSHNNDSTIKESC
eukprot:scaffold157799_cov33-Attheya_sp.AAC.1